MTNDKLLKTGIIGTVVAALCCFTPLLVVIFAGLGISALMGWWLDAFVLFPALFGFLGLTAYALWRRRQAGSADEGKETS